MNDYTWNHGCDACDSEAEVVYLSPIDYLCQQCRQPENLSKIYELLANDEDIVNDH